MLWTSEKEGGSVIVLLRYTIYAEPVCIWVYNRYAYSMAKVYNQTLSLEDIRRTSRYKRTALYRSIPTAIQALAITGDNS